MAGPEASPHRGGNVGEGPLHHLLRAHQGGGLRPYRRRRPRRAIYRELPHQLHHPLRPAAPGGEYPPAGGHRGAEHIALRPPCRHVQPSVHHRPKAMKILAAGMNYARHNKEAGCALDYTEPIIFTKPDSALLRDGKPFFLPQAWGEISYEAEVVVRICRLGKNIAAKFASRYYEEAGICLAIEASDLLEKLKAELASEEFEIQRCENLLKNEKFVSKAPKEKVELEREKLKNHLEIKAKILEKIENL